MSTVVTRLVITLLLTSLLVGLRGFRRAPILRHGDRGRAPRREDAPLRAAPLAERLATTQRALDAAIQRWRERGDIRSGRPPREVTLLALDEQRIHVLLAERRRLAARVLAPGRRRVHSLDVGLVWVGRNIRDPHDAILGAANYLHASGAPGDVRRALFSYNPSDHYVNAVLAYAERIRRDRRAFFSYYSWQVYVRTTAGTRRITGPGLQSATIASISTSAPLGSEATPMATRAGGSAPSKNDP